MKIELTIGTETRKVEAITAGPFVTVHGIKMVTAKGGQEHVGSVSLRPNANNAYTLGDAVRISYPGMRGNGTAERSRFRRIGF